MGSFSFSQYRDEGIALVSVVVPMWFFAASVVLKNVEFVS